MANHLWFIPVSSGNTLGEGVGAFPIAPTRDLTNVQWNFSVYPVTQDPPAEVSCLSYSSYTTFVMGSDAGPSASELRQCYGSWRWRSCADDTNIITGGQLAVGTVFARELAVNNADPQNPIMWNQVDVWAKYRVSNVARLDNIFLTINDSAGSANSCANNIGNTVNNVWRVVTHQKIASWDGWDSDNLRVTLTFQGTTVLANVGVVIIDVEWFAIRLSDER